MDIKQMLATALRNFVPQPDPVVGAAKGALGQSGAAQRVNANTREAYIQYAESEMAQGRQPMRYDEWVNRDPMTSQVGG